jgi:flagellar secretion chaperone FliS
MPVALSFQTSDRHGSFGKHGPAVDPYGIARLLMDGALERIEAAREHLANGEQPAKQSQLQSAVMIIGELRAYLDLSAGDPIAANLDDLYDYMCRRLGASDRLPAADLTNGIAALDEVSHLLDALHSAWTFMPAEVRAASRN